jgi:predicted ester cyclase
MSLEDNKVLIQRFIDEVLNAGNITAIANFCIPGSMFARGIEGQVKAFKIGFPDYHLTIDEILAEGNKVAVHATMHGTHTGPLIGLPAFGSFETPVPPTGKSVLWNRMYIFTISDGKILNFAAESDQLGLLQQLGWAFVPPDQT